MMNFKKSEAQLRFQRYRRELRSIVADGALDEELFDLSDLDPTDINDLEFIRLVNSARILAKVYGPEIFFDQA
jgi:hypothetical protein